jgi:hypothetical protein
MQIANQRKREISALRIAALAVALRLDVKYNAHFRRYLFGM